MLPEHATTNITTDEFLRVNEPAIIRPSGRPPKTKNKKRTRVQAFEDFTQREPFGFEHVKRQRQRQRQRQRGLAITANQITDQEDMTAVDEFFEPTSVIIIREGSVTRGAIRGAI